MNIIYFISLLCFTWLFTTGAAPIQFIKTFFKVNIDSNPKDITRKIIAALINCDLCTGFWVGLIYYQDFLLACIVSLCAELFGRGLAKIGL